jgi:transcriptional regulator GlxA family with amidase domain
MRQKRRNGHDRGETDTNGAEGRIGGGFIDVGILVLPTVHTSALYGALDILSSTDTYWDRQRKYVRGPSRLRVRLIGASGDPVEGWNGVVVQPSASIAEVQRTDVLYIPALGAPEGEVPAAGPEVCRWIRQQYEAGAIVATACSGSIVLAEAGLLDDQPATTHWAYADTFAQRFPGTRLCAERALVLAGSGQRIITAGGGSLWSELILYLIARVLGREAAVHTAKLYLLGWGRDDQVIYSLFQERLQHADAPIRKAQRHITAHAVEPDVLTAARAESGLSDRTFERRFKSASGVSPGRYVQEVRIEMAKEAIEQSARPIDDIAFEVGYADPASFRRLFKRLVGVTPSAYRRRMTPPG